MDVNPLFLAIMNQHVAMHHGGWMVSDQETLILYWVSIPYLTMVVRLIAFIMLLHAKNIPQINSYFR
jgi:hypothetical protein